eukprot:CAMPEP_0196129772 /NCGR_PEP_ID=MMETSP0910-20130528/376_1 /TAXON_ID=49265 /ORGANISM="Thalassiosira rotula, Strain GSO102" /LENGTH=229 /DNA_ID=CAMNT_0041388949 /DNA_START=225 /DNA_END=914 /DNA_ORIENTATION=+
MASPLVPLSARNGKQNQQAMERTDSQRTKIASNERFTSQIAFVVWLFFLYALFIVTNFLLPSIIFYHVGMAKMLSLTKQMDRLPRFRNNSVVRQMDNDCVASVYLILLFPLRMLAYAIEVYLSPEAYGIGEFMCLIFFIVYIALSIPLVWVASRKVYLTLCDVRTIAPGKKMFFFSVTSGCDVGPGAKPLGFRSRGKTFLGQYARNFLGWEHMSVYLRRGDGLDLSNDK